VTPVEQEMVEAAVQAAVAAAKAGASVRRNAIVASVDPTNHTATVMPDGPGAVAHPADIAAPYTFRVGDRVQVEYTSPRGCVVVGRHGGDWSPWEEFGENGAPFLNGWGHRTDAGELGEDKPGRASYRLHSGRVELGGWLQKLTGSANNAAQLRSDCYPEVRRTFVVSNGLGEPTTLQISPATAATPGAILALLADSHLCLDGISFSVRPASGD
jgi:hypothetical protein